MKQSKAEPTPAAKKLEELYELIADMEIALMTTRRPNGMLVTRPMATQKRESIADLWFVTDVESHKVDELHADPHVSLGYYNSKTYEWVSVSGTAAITQDRRKILNCTNPTGRPGLTTKAESATAAPTTRGSR